MTSDKIDDALSEEGINSRLHYRFFTEHGQKYAAWKVKKLERTCDKSNRSTLALLGLDDVQFQSAISVFPEFLAYTFHLYGLSRKLLNYLIYYEVNAATNVFVFDDAAIDRFKEFCLVFEERLEDSATVVQSLKRLKQMNTIVAAGEGAYMLNPLIAGPPSSTRRRKLIEAYCRYLEEEGLDTSADFYPRQQVF